MNSGTAQVHLASLLRTEALYLLAGTRTGLLVCAHQGLMVRRPGFHTLADGDVVVRTTTDTELETGLPVTYQAESMDEETLAGWHATVTGTATAVKDPRERDHYQRALPAFANGQGNQIIRIRPRLVGGHRFQRLAATPGPH